MFALLRKCLAYAFVCLVFSAGAQQNLTEVVVSTTKLPQKESELTKSMVILTDSVIKANSGLNVSQLLQKQAGFTIIGAGQTPGSIQSVYNRGANTGYTLILIDGVPLYDPSYIESNFDLNLINLNNIERIEVLKGGQSVLYGSDAVAGVINFITKKKGQKMVEPTALFSAGSYKTVNARIGLKGELSGLGYQVSYEKQKSEGISSAVSDDSEEEKDGLNSDNLSLNLSKSFGAFNLGVFGRLMNYKADVDAGAFVDDKDYTSEIKNKQIGGSIDWIKERAQLHFKFNSSVIDRFFEDDSTFVPATAFANYSYATYGSKSTFAELYGSFNLSDNLNLLTGFDYRKQNMAQTYLSVSSFGPFEDTPLTESDTEISNSSIYSSLNGKLNSGLGLEIAGRYNSHSVYGENMSWTINPYFIINKNLTVFSVYGTSFKNPSLYQLYSPYGNLDLEMEEAKNLDMGLKYNNVTMGTQLQLTYFDRKIENLIVFMSLSEDPYGQYVNQDKQRVRGIEANVAQNLGKLSLNGNYTYLSGFVIDNVEDETKTDLLRRPKHQINLGVAHSISNKLSAALDLALAGERIDRFYNSSTFGTEEITLESYALLNLNVQYKVTKAFTAFCNFRNILNTNYTEINGYNTQGATAQIGIRLN